ncbi:MAG: glycoside hydrolase family 38 N-terminal domain-containing protein [Candidatus Dormibacteria bacterium]
MGKPLIVHMIGNAHIDPVWLWGWQQGADEVLTTFSAAADRCDEYPEFIFTAGEAWRYQQVERVDPALFARIRALVRQGRWHVTGGQVVQPDCNLPTLAGWREQLRSGRAYFADRFGVEPTTCYNVDSFGHPNTLPDIFAEAGIASYVIGRPSPAQVPLPAMTFRWRGPGGGEVTVFRIEPTYVTRSSDLYGQVLLALDGADPALGHVMCFYGVGDHGGGPTKASIEWILEGRASLPGVELRFSTPQAFFAAVRESGVELPVVEAELQHVFPGCYSVMHDIKRAQRHGEHLLEQAREVAEDLGGDTNERAAATERVQRAWQELLFTQFHDVLAGTSTPSSWASIRAMQGRAQIEAERVIFEVSRRWAQRQLTSVNHHQVVAINAGSVPFDGLVETEPWLDDGEWGRRWLSTPDGAPVEYQLVAPQSPQFPVRLLFPARIAAGGHVQVLLRDDDPATERGGDGSPQLTVSPHLLANGRLRVELGPDGIAQVLVDSTPLLGPGGMSLQLRADPTDTWSLFADGFTEPVTGRLHGASWVVDEDGPLRARVRLEARLGDSSLLWSVSLERDRPEVHLALEVNFAERHRALQLSTDLATAPERWRDGQAGGWVNRTPGITEWPVQGWSAVPTAGRDLALTSGDAYSLSVNGTAWTWTLLRSPRMAWMGSPHIIDRGRQWFTDQGVHNFEFLLTAAERLDPEDLERLARRQLRPLVTFDRYRGLDRPAWGVMAPPRLWTEMEHRAARERAALEQRRPAPDA